MTTLNNVIPISWAGVDSEIGRYVVQISQRNLDAYSVNKLLVQEHANIERSTAQGGYGKRQIYELIQNGADELINYSGGKIQVVLTEEALYCANQGEPLRAQGLEAILYSHISKKRGTEIGRFGLGFKSVLGVTNQPEFYSRTGSFCFDPKYAAERIYELGITTSRTPILRIARPLDPVEAAEKDSILAELMEWAVTIVKLPRTVAEANWINGDLKQFPAEFLLFSPHVGELRLEDRTKGLTRDIKLERENEKITLVEGENISVWRVFSILHRPSFAAKKDAGELSDREELPLSWAVQLQGAGRGAFWAFFPTRFETTLSGIVNAPWKTNEDRQILLEGAFNNELIDAAAKLVADNLETIGAKESDPGKLLDIIPARGREAPNWADELITERVYQYAADKKCLPDMNGILRTPSELKLQPTLSGEADSAIDIWASYKNRPSDWCHPKASTYHRRSRTERLLKSVGRFPATIDKWLEALVTDGSAEASIAALRVAAALITENPKVKAEIERARIVLANEGKTIVISIKINFKYMVKTCRKIYTCEASEIMLE